jgi:hypothetical protein
VAKRMSKEYRAKRDAMRLVAYIRAVGFDPSPFDHGSFQSYRACLQKQYDTLRASMDRESGQRARLAGRKLVRLHTLKGAAGDVVPNELPFTVRSSRRGEGRHNSLPSNERDVPSPVLAVATANPSGREIANCRRKLRHVDYLSALFHLIRLGDPGLHAYPCELCDGIHVGHHPDRVKSRDLKEELISIEARIAALEVERRQLEERRTSLSAHEKRLKDTWSLS